MKLINRPATKRFFVKKNGAAVSSFRSVMSWDEAYELANQEASRKGKPCVEIINTETLEVVWSAN